MPPTTPKVPPKPASPKDQAATDAYAKSLLALASVEYKNNESSNPGPKHIFSKNRLILLAVSTVISIIIGFMFSHLSKHSPSTNTDLKSDASQTQQLLNSDVPTNN